MTKFLAPLTNMRIVRKIADAALVRYAHHRTLSLDRMDAGKVQHATSAEARAHARRTRGSAAITTSRASRSVADYQARVPVRDYEWFWNTYWKDAYPRLDDITWPGKIPYYALSSGTTSGATKYIPVSWEMVKSNKKAGFTTTALFRHANPDAKLFTGKFFFLGGSTDLRKQADGSLAGDLSGIAAKEVLRVPAAVHVPTVRPLAADRLGSEVRRFAELSAHEPITALSGIPAWMFVLFDKLKQVTGKKTVAEAWPDLRLVIHGGTKFDPYRDLFKKRDRQRPREVLRSVPVFGRLHRHRRPALQPAAHRARSRHLLRVRAGGRPGQGVRRRDTRSRTSKSACSMRSCSRRARACGRISLAIRCAFEKPQSAADCGSPAARSTSSQRSANTSSARKSRRRWRTRARCAACISARTSTSARCSRRSRASRGTTCT